MIFEITTKISEPSPGPLYSKVQKLVSEGGWNNRRILEKILYVVEDNYCNYSTIPRNIAFFEMSDDCWDRRRWERDCSEKLVGTVQEDKEQRCGTLIHEKGGFI